jgi:predicted naringenin-chalcone synthase
MENSDIYFVQRLVVDHGQYTYPQSHLLEDMRSKLSSLQDIDQLLQVIGFIYEHSDITQRHFEFPLSEIPQRREQVGWYRLVNEAVLSQTERILKDLFSEGISASDCDGFIAVSSCFSGFPSITKLLLERLGFSLDTLCFDLSGLGCIGALQGMYLAHTLVQSGRCRNVCVVCVDAMGTHEQSRRHVRVPSISEIVGHCLVSDAATALIISKDPGPKPMFSYESFELTSKLWGNSEDQNVLTSSEESEPIISIGKDIRTRLIKELSPFMTQEVLNEAALIHPGGAALVRELNRRYPQISQYVSLALSVYEDHGNMGASTILWVLHRALTQRRQWRRKSDPLITSCFRMISFGPGKITAILTVKGVGLLDTETNIRESEKIISEK